MTENPIRLAVIVGSTREGRFGGTVADWFTGQAREYGDLDIDTIDLADLGLPAVHTARPAPEVRHFGDRVDAADAFVVITPEYNHGYPASLKHAIDSANQQWYAKPVGFVSYGGISGGLRAVEQLRQVFAELHTVTVRDSVSFHGAHAEFDDGGEPHDQVGPRAASKTLLDQITWWATALRDARSVRPYRA